MDVMMESMESLSVVSTENDTPELRKSSRRSSISEQNLHKTNRRTISKPKKKTFDLDPGNQTAIKNFYLNINKSSKFKAIPLETIYEQDEEDDDVDEVNISSSSSNQKDIGTRKIKRCLTVTSGLKANKTLSNKRKSQIKKHLGPRKRAKKISINNFMEYFKSQINQTEDVISSESTEVVTKEPVLLNLEKD